MKYAILIAAGIFGAAAGIFGDIEYSGADARNTCLVKIRDFVPTPRKMAFHSIRETRGAGNEWLVVGSAGPMDYAAARVTHRFGCRVRAGRVVAHNVSKVL